MMIAVAEPERIDTWVFRVGIAIPLVCLAVLVLWQLLSYLGRKRGRERRAARESPEPKAPSPQDDPARLERACAALEERLAQMYLDLAESWIRAGQTQQAVAVWEKVVERSPQTAQAQVARERLRRPGSS